VHLLASVASPAPISLTGVLERIIFFNEENHYTIAELRPEAAKTAEDRVTIVGALPGVQCGETLLLTGEWTRHAQHGAQFKIATHKSELPSSVYGIRKYLGSGLVPGIGKVYANKIVDKFGTDTFRVLSEESGKLRKVEGIGKVRATAIKQAWEEQKTLREVHIFLQTYGVTTSQCVKLVTQYGGEAQRVLTHEPYRVAREIDGIGFKTADRIAINLGYANDAPPRLDAGIIFALETLQEEGHTAYPRGELVRLPPTCSKPRNARRPASMGARGIQGPRATGPGVADPDRAARASTRPFDLRNDRDPLILDPAPAQRPRRAEDRRRRPRLTAVPAACRPSRSMPPSCGPSTRPGSSSTNCSAPPSATRSRTSSPSSPAARARAKPRSCAPSSTS
jgi:exodeoxyribonuclease V alpha subunit